MDEYPYELMVEGDWSNVSLKTVTNKLQLYFQKKKKSGGGDCVVKISEQSRTAVVQFKSSEIRDNVLAKGDHSVTIDEKLVKLKVFKPSEAETQQKLSEEKSVPTGSGSDAATDQPRDDPDETHNLQCSAVVIEELPDDLTKDILVLLVENITGISEEKIVLELISESKTAVVTFSEPKGADKFLLGSKSNKKFQQYGLQIRPLEKCRCIKVENLPAQSAKDLLELYFEKWGGKIESVITHREEKAAIVTFHNPEVVDKLLKHEHHIAKTPVSVYPYFKSLGTALYGKDRPRWNLPKFFTEKIHPAIVKFLQKKGLIASISNHMAAQFCQVNMGKDEVLLSPDPALLRMQGLTKMHIDNWQQNTTDTLRNIISNYDVFEYNVAPSLRSTIEKDMQSIVKDKAVFWMDTSRGVMTMAGMARDISVLKQRIEDYLSKALSKIERDTNSTLDFMQMSPAMYFLFLQDGLQSTAAAKYPELKLTYKQDTNQLMLHGLPLETSDMKNWILERQIGMKHKLLKADKLLLEFLKAVDSTNMSANLFINKGIYAFYTVENGDVVLTSSTEKGLTEAEKSIEVLLKFHAFSLDNPHVLKKPEWHKLCHQLCDTYNTPRKIAVLITTLKQGQKVIVSGFKEPVTEISRTLEEFVNTHSVTQDNIHFESYAVVKFIKDKKSQVWQKFVNQVKVDFDSRRPLLKLSGERMHVQPAMECFQKIIETLHTDRLVIDKAGAKKYFQDQEAMFIMMIKDYRFVIVLEEDNMKAEGEIDYSDVGGDSFEQPSCEVRIPGGFIISVRKTDICKFRVDAVVNAANEDLKHIGGVALALLNAAGPHLQECSDRYTLANGKVQPGNAVTTEAGNLPCKYVIHAVGPRYYDTDSATAVRRLRQALRESLKEAEINNCSSIAIPTISSGVFGFPLELCTETLAKELHAYVEDKKRQSGMTTLKMIHLVDNNANTVNAMAQAVKKAFIAWNPKMGFPNQMSSRGRGHRGRGQSYRGQSYRGQSYRGHGNRGQGFRSQSTRGQGNHRFGARGHEPEASIERVNEEFESQTMNSFSGPQYKGKSETLETRLTQEGLKLILRIGSIEDSVSDVIVNTISKDLDLSTGAISKALLKAAGNQLQLEASKNVASSGSSVNYGDIIETNGYNLNCQRVFHTVCPYWRGGRNSENEELKQIICNCLKKAENQQMTSISFPAIGTGNLGFPKGVVSSIMLNEIHTFSSKAKPLHLKQVTVVVHPSDNETAQCFTKSFKGEGQVTITKGAHAIQQSPVKKAPAVPSTQTSGLFGTVSTTSPGVHSVQVGNVTLEVSSGDITKEICDAIVNSSNQTFSLKSGVSKAIVDAAGSSVELECAQIVQASPHQKEIIMTSGGQLSCKKIIHIIGRNTAAGIKNAVYSVLTLCESQQISSVAIPALGTGQGGVSASDVADAMINALVDFVKKKEAVCLQSVKFVIFQTSMVSDFHQSMLKRQNTGGEEGGGVLAWMKDKVDSMFNYFSPHSSDSSQKGDFVMAGEEFEPAVFQLCGETEQDLRDAQKCIKSFIFKDYCSSSIQDSAIRQFGREEADVLKALQRELTVSIRVEKQDLEQSIIMEGIARDVVKAESRIRDLIRKVEKAESRKREAFLLNSMVEWQYMDEKNNMVPFDPLTNYDLEEAFKLKKPRIMITINSEQYEANLDTKVAVGKNRQIELKRIEQKDQGSVSLPSHWENMTPSDKFLKQVEIQQNTQEYDDVEKKFKSTGLTCTILKIERIQNSTLWKNYMIQKKHLEDKNKHQNNERELFHGTGHENLDKINTQGFNRSYAGKNGAMYGNGVYFAVDASYSAQGYSTPDLNGHKRMYLARVLVGDYTSGTAGLKAPPAKSSTGADLYDSVTDNQQNPTMFVIFHDVQAYPEYLITFQ